MKNERKEKVLSNMTKIGEIANSKLDRNAQKIDREMYYNDFEFKGSGLAAKDVYIVKIENKNIDKAAHNSEKNDKSNDITAYEIYGEDQQLIATVTAEGKLHFSSEYIEQLKQIDSKCFEQLNIEDLEFELPQELNENDIVLDEQELADYKEKATGKKVDRTMEGKEKNEDDEEIEKNPDEEDKEKEEKTETEEEKKAKTAQALGISEDEIKSISTINQNQKVTDKYNLRDMMPESAEYQSVSIAYTKQGTFTVLGIKDDGTREKLNSIDPIEGTTSSKSVISINDDGSRVEEKQVKGLLRINARNRDDGIAISIGNYGMMNIDYVNNVMDKEHRRSTPIRTVESENQRIANAQVRENAGDSKEEMQKEGEIYREKQNAGVDPQTLDGIETDNMYGNITLEELKENIKEQALDKDDLSSADMKEFIKSEIEKSGLNLTQNEMENTVQEVETEVLDESRFPTRE